MEKKRFSLGLRAALLVIMLIMIFSISSKQTLSEEYSTAHPIIEVYYKEIPVSILAYNLSDAVHNPVAVRNITGLRNDLSFNFTTRYLPNGEYSFWIFAADEDASWDESMAHTSSCRNREYFDV
jgi:hypothetical protein